MQKLRIAAKLDNLDQVLAFLDENLESWECSMRLQTQLDIAVEEIFVNIAHYAYTESEGEAEIGLSFDEATKEVTVTFTDWGIPFDPTAKEDPDVSLSAEERQIGGLGIFMVKKSMDSMRYERKDDSNILVIVKRIG